MNFNTAMDEPKDYLYLSFTAAIASMVSAVIGPSALFIEGFLDASNVAVSSLHWWQADFLGISLGTPLFLVWRNLPADWLRTPRFLEFLALFSMVFLVGQIEFFEWYYPAAANYSELYWFFLLITIAAIRFGRHGVLLLSAMVAIQALWGVDSHTGRFKHDLVNTGLQVFWFFQLTLTGVGLALPWLWSCGLEIKSISNYKKVSSF